MHDIELFDSKEVEEDEV